MGGQNGGALDKNCGAFCKKKLLALFGAFRKNNGASQFETVNNTVSWLVSFGKITLCYLLVTHLLIARSFLELDLDGALLRSPKFPY